MSQFPLFKQAVQHQFNFLKKHRIFRMDVSKDLLWETYLKAFPAGTDPIYRERTEHDCSCCRAFVKHVGAAVAIVDGKLASLWDVRVDNEAYQAVANAMAALVKEQFISNIFLHPEPSVGVDKNFETLESGQVLTYTHFHIQLPRELVSPGKDIPTKLSETQASRDVFYRSLAEISAEACDTVLELIAQNSLYRGEEHKFVVSEFLKIKRQFTKLTKVEEQDLFCWSHLSTPQSVLRIRNTAIGTLLTDLSEGVDLEHAVASFEAKVAPQNYKRPTALVTKAMVENAQKKIKELGLLDSLERRFARREDISVNNILFVDRSVRKNLQGDIFDDIAGGLGSNTKHLDRVEEIGIDKFISDILPRAQSLEVLLENRHKQNLVSLIAPANLTAKGMFKWNNHFSWSYAGDLADSIKERVKAAGGKVDADLRCSLSWFNYDDLDLHLKLPNGRTIYFSNRIDSTTLGQLDVDMNAGAGKTREAVENIFFASRNHMLEGRYVLYVNQFAKRESIDVGFDAEIEFDGVITSFSYKKAVPDKANVVVAEFDFSKKTGITFINSLDSTESKRVETHWNLPTQTFHRVNLMMLSPNHWDEQVVGNKHFFIFLEGCLNDGSSRGFFNEFLSQELDPHRKVLEIVGAKMKTEESEHQLSGLGFSSTRRESLVFKVSGSFTRTVKVLF